MAITGTGDQGYRSTVNVSDLASARHGETGSGGLPVARRAAARSPGHAGGHASEPDESGTPGPTLTPRAGHCATVRPPPVPALARSAGGDTGESSRRGRRVDRDRY